MEIIPVKMENSSRGTGLTGFWKDQECGRTRISIDMRESS